MSGEGQMDIDTENIDTGSAFLMVFMFLCICAIPFYFIGDTSASKTRIVTEYKYTFIDKTMIGLCWFNLFINIVTILVSITDKPLKTLERFIYILLIIGLLSYYVYGIPFIYKKNKTMSMPVRYIMHIVNIGLTLYKLPRDFKILYNDVL